MQKLNDIKTLALKWETLGWFYRESREKKLEAEKNPIQKHQFNALRLLALAKPCQLYHILNTPSLNELNIAINYPRYSHYKLEKKKGGTRDIYEPDLALKKIQKSLNYFLQAYYLWIKPAEVHGFVINPTYLETSSNIVENAKAHVGKKVVLNMDLENFFPSIKAYQIKELFTSPIFQFDEQIATALTLLTTYKGSLPIGAPTSPVISNFICYQFDQEIIDYATKNQLAYSRYADDLTFSSNTEITKNNLAEISALIVKHGFILNEKKLRIRSSNKKQTVTGLVVNEKVNVDRVLMKKVRAMLHDLEQSGVDLAASRHHKFRTDYSASQTDSFIRRLEGYINFIGQVRGKEDLVYLRMKGKMELINCYY